MSRLRGAAFRLGALTLPLFAGVLLVVVCEGVAWWWMARSDPLGAERIAEEHPVGFGRDSSLRTDHRGRRLRRDPIPFHPLFGWRYPGDAVFWGLRVSEEGFVLDDPEGASAFDESAALEILVLGGSSVAGAGASSSRQTISAHLEELLSQRLGQRVNVVNGGVGGWYSANQLAFLVAEALPFQRPGLVVVLDGYNDSWRAARSAARYPGSTGTGRYPPAPDHLIDYELDRQKRTFTALERQDPSAALREWLSTLGVQAWLEPSRYFIVRLLRDAPRESRVEARTSGQGDCEPVPVDVGPYVTAVRAAYGAASANGIALLHFLQPSVAFKEILHPNEEGPLARVQRTIAAGAWRWYGIGEQVCFLEFQREFFEAAEAALEACCGGWGGASLVRLFAEREDDLFYDYAHYTDLANREIAAVVAERVAAVCQSGGCSAGAASKFVVDGAP